MCSHKELHLLCAATWKPRQSTEWDTCTTWWHEGSGDAVIWGRRDEMRPYVVPLSFHPGLCRLITPHQSPEGVYQKNQTAAVGELQILNSHTDSKQEHRRSKRSAVSRWPPIRKGPHRTKRWSVVAEPWRCRDDANILNIKCHHFLITGAWAHVLSSQPRRPLTKFISIS